MVDRLPKPFFFAGAQRLVYLHCWLALCLNSPLLWAQEQQDIDRQLTNCEQLTDPRQVDFNFDAATHSLNPPLLPRAATIGHIVFIRFPIFNLNDPEENNRLFQWANKLHIKTLESTLREQLLFTSGDDYDSDVLVESMRILRSRSYLYEARIFPYQICGNRVDIMVLTRDVWTLTPGISFSREGGVNSKQFVLRDSNLLGLGKQLTLARKETVDRDGWVVGYVDPQLLGSRTSLGLLYADNDDGRRQRLALGQPFYALATRRSWFLLVDDDKRTDKLYQRGESVAAFRVEENQYQLSAGWLVDRQAHSATRSLLGFRWHQETFSEDPGEIPPQDFPIDREINQLWIGRQFIEDDFITLRNFGQIYRTEDLNLGRRWSTRVGWSDKDWGSDSDRLVYALDFGDIRSFADQQLLSYRFELEGLWNANDNRSEDILLSNRFRYYNAYQEKRALLVALGLDYSRNLPFNEQLLLGGEENLRGYPLRYQEGDRRFFLSVEQRFYFEKHWYRLFRVGAAVFADIGRAWFPGEKNSGATGVLSDIGFGLRFSSSRAEKNRTLHVDVAFPLEKEEDVDSVQLLVSGKAGF